MRATAPGDLLAVGLIQWNELFLALRKSTVPGIDRGRVWDDFSLNRKAASQNFWNEYGKCIDDSGGFTRLMQWVFKPVVDRITSTLDGLSDHLAALHALKEAEDNFSSESSKAVEALSEKWGIANSASSFPRLIREKQSDLDSATSRSRSILRALGESSPWSGSCKPFSRWSG